MSKIHSIPRQPQAELKQQLADQNAAYSDLVQEYNIQKGKNRKLTDELEDEIAGTRRARRNKEDSLRDAEAQIRVATGERDAVLKATQALRVALETSQLNSQAAEKALLDLLAEHVELQKTVRAMEVEVATHRPSVSETVNEHEEESIPSIHSAASMSDPFESKPQRRFESPEANFSQPPTPVSPIPSHSHLRRDSRNERQLYIDYMAKFPVPADRLLYRDNKPVGGRDSDVLDPTTWSPSHPRQYLYLPRRSVWCSTTDRVHALAFAPVEEVNTNRQVPGVWAPHTTLRERVDREFELFMVGDENSPDDDLFYYVGIYRLRCLQDVNPPGSAVPKDISRSAILRAMKFRSKAALEQGLTIHDRYPSGVPQVECFGLQCVGFDWNLYRDMRRVFKDGRDRPPRGRRRSRSYSPGPRRRSLSPPARPKKKDKNKKSKYWDGDLVRGRSDAGWARIKQEPKDEWV